LASARYPGNGPNQPECADETSMMPFARRTCLLMWFKRVTILMNCVDRSTTLNCTEFPNSSCFKMFLHGRLCEAGAGCGAGA
jgi:hypothetical protein